MTKTIIHDTDVASAKSGDTKATAKITEDMDPALWSLANKIGGKFHAEDAHSEGVLAVLGAIQSYEPGRSASTFFTHAYTAAKHAMSEYVSSNGYDGPSVPGRSVRRYHQHMKAANGDLVEAQQLALANSSMGHATFMAVHTAVTGVQHLDLAVDGDDGETFNPVMDQASMQMGHQQQFDDVDNALLVSDMFSTLSDKEILILSMYYGIGGHEPISDHEIAAKINLSRSRVTNIRNDVERRLGTQFAEAI